MIYLQLLIWYFSWFTAQIKFMFYFSHIILKNMTFFVYLFFMKSRIMSFFKKKKNNNFLLDLGLMWVYFFHKYSHNFRYPMHILLAGSISSHILNHVKSQIKRVIILNISYIEILYSPAYICIYISLIHSVIRA